MLCLSRKVGERLVIGKDIVVQIIRTHSGKVRLGLSAPKDVHIRREELLPQDELAELEKLLEAA